MADTAFQTRYRQEFIAGFEQKQTLLRQTVTTEADIRGNQAVFLVADSGDASAKTRGVDGLIPARADNLTQYTATIAEWHDLVRRTRFNIYASQGDGRRIMQETTIGVVNRKIDQDIITELNTATNDTGAATTGSLNLATHAMAILGNNEVPFDGNVWALISPAFLAYLMQVPEFASADYVNMKPLDGGAPTWRDQQGFYNWMNIKWIVHPRLPGSAGVGAAGTAEKCFMYHSSAVGHAFDTNGLDIAVGYDDEQDYSYARATTFMGSKLLQNSGVVVINHDGSAFAAS